MRRTSLLCLVALLTVVLAAPAAQATQGEPGVCPAGSLWTDVDYVVSGDFTQSGFYQWYWNLGDGSAIAALRALLPNWTDEQIYTDFFAPYFANDTDRNGDLEVCVFWLGANRGQTDQWITVIDNQTQAHH